MRPDLRLARLPSPIGDLLIVTDETDTLRALEFADTEPRLHRHTKGQTLRPASLPQPIRTALEAYFAGTLTALDTLPVTPSGTPFQNKVWSELRRIHPGATTTYASLAAQIGHPTAIRATGAANGANPISLVIPCHRVIGADGTLTGYGGGLPRKAWLLNHERLNASAQGTPKPTG